MAPEIRTERLYREAANGLSVSGFLHSTTGKPSRGIVLTHGAGGNCNSPLLIALSDEFARNGFLALRCDLLFRQARPKGPPRPGDASKDRAGLKQAAQVVREITGGVVLLGGQSYGGRQASMLTAEEPDEASGLVLLSYPLHPPGKPERLRTEHFPKIRVNALFVSGTSDPFATIEELRHAVKMIPSRTKILPADGVGHDLGFGAKKRGNPELAKHVYQVAMELFASH